MKTSLPIFGLQELWHTDGKHDDFVGTLAGTTPGHCQPVFIMTLERSINPASQEDMHLLRREKIDRDSVMKHVIFICLVAT